MAAARISHSAAAPALSLEAQAARTIAALDEALSRLTRLLRPAVTHAAPVPIAGAASSLADEAQREIARCDHIARSTGHYRDALAAFEAGDFARALLAAECAVDFSNAMRM